MDKGILVQIVFICLLVVFGVSVHLSDRLYVFVSGGSMWDALFRYFGCLAVLCILAICITLKVSGE